MLFLPSQCRTRPEVSRTSNLPDERCLWGDISWTEKWMKTLHWRDKRNKYFCIKIMFERYLGPSTLCIFIFLLSLQFPTGIQLLVTFLELKLRPASSCWHWPGTLSWLFIPSLLVFFSFFVAPLALWTTVFFFSKNVDHVEVDVLARNHIFSFFQLLSHNCDCQLYPEQDVTDLTKIFLAALALSWPSSVMQYLLFWFWLSLSQPWCHPVYLSHLGDYVRRPWGPFSISKHTHETEVVLTHLHMHTSINGYGYIYLHISIYIHKLLIAKLSSSVSTREALKRRFFWYN